LEKSMKDMVAIGFIAWEEIYISLCNNSQCNHFFICFTIED